MDLKKFKAPNTIGILFSLIILMAVLTWIIPAGEFERIVKGEQTIVNSESFHYVDSNPQNIDAVLKAPIRGFIDAAQIIGFVLIVGGAFYVFQKTGAVDSAIKAVVQAHDKSKFIRAFLIPIFMTMFSLGGAIFGMCEEVIPFIMIFVPMAYALGYDSITGVAIPFIGAGAGFAGAFANPFTIGIAQGIAELPPFSGIEYRVIVWFIVTAITILFVSMYARKIKKHPEKSLMYELDKKKREKMKEEIKEDNSEGINNVHKRVLVTFLLGLIVLIFGVLKYEWYINEICALFLILGIAVGVVGKLKMKDITGAFTQGAKELVATGIIIALARGIVIIASDGKIIDPILHSLASVVNILHPSIASFAMFFTESFINFFVPSGSGQAALTMPIMAPLSDLIGVSRQTAVLAYQFGDGFTNLIIPTSAVTMSVLMLAGIPWEKWARWILPYIALTYILSLILLIPPYFFGW